jgi:hypothetical protein
MTIPTQISLQGFIATAPELTFTGKGHARFYCRVGIEQHRKEVDGSFTKLDPVSTATGDVRPLRRAGLPEVQARRPDRCLGLRPRVRAGAPRRSQPDP